MVLKNGVEQVTLISGTCWTRFYLSLMLAAMTIKSLTASILTNCRSLVRQELVISLVKLGYSVIGHSCLQLGPKD